MVGAGTVRPSLLVWAALLLFLVTSLLTLRHPGVAHGFDEIAHISYVAELQEANGAVPLDRLRMLDPATFAFTTTGNYINHPDSYYRLMALGPRLFGDPSALRWLRIANVAIVLGALGLLLATMLALVRSTDEALVTIVALACIPTLAPLAAQVNNDNGAVLAGALTLFGATRFLKGGGRRALAVAGAGLALAGAIKLTALLLCAIFLVAVVALAGRRGLVRAPHLFILAAALAVAAIAPLALLLDYGSPAPNTPAQLAMLRGGSARAGWDVAPRLGMGAYLGVFLTMFTESWRPLLADRSAFQTALLALPLALAALATAGTALAARDELRRRTPLDPAAVLALGGAAAALATLIVHIAFSYQRHLETGWLLDAYARYYLPVIGTVPIACLVLMRAAALAVRRALAAFLIAAPIAFSLLG